MSAKPPIIIVKKKGGHGGHHGGAWKVAYADFVTAMMALFIVLWLMSSSKPIQVAVGGYFKDPSGKSAKIGSAMEGAGESFAVSKDNMSQLKEELQKTMRQVPHFDEMKNQIEMTITSEGLRIELLESGKSLFFNSGNAVPSADGKEILTLLAKELGSAAEQNCHRGAHRLQAVRSGKHVRELGALRGSRQCRPQSDAAKRNSRRSDHAGERFRRSAASQVRCSPGSVQPADFSDRPVPGQESSRPGR